MTDWTAYEQDDGAAAQQQPMIAVCPYCSKEHPTDVVNAAGECPTILCCGETHCYLRHGPLDTEDNHENF